MPAVGWIIGALLTPTLQLRFGMHVRRLMQLFLALGILALIGLQFATGYTEMTALRLIFGGAIGSFLRCFEYWMVGVSETQDRARTVSIFSILFMVALLLGAAVQPELGTIGWLAFAPPVLLLVAGLLLLQVWRGRSVPQIDPAGPAASLRVALAMPAALIAVVTFGMYESGPTTLLPIYAVRNGLDEAAAAYTLSAMALGNIVVQYPMAALSDRVGRSGPLLLNAIIAATATALIPLTLDSMFAYLTAVVVLGGAAGSLYSLALAMIGDRFDGGDLVVANATLGVAYAVASIVGPMVNGAAMDLSPSGLLMSLSLIFCGLALIVAAGQLQDAKRADR